MRRTKMTTQFDQETSGAVLPAQILEKPAPKIDLGSESEGWLDVFEGIWGTKSEPAIGEGV